MSADEEKAAEPSVSGPPSSGKGWAWLGAVVTTAASLLFGWCQKEDRIWIEGRAKKELGDKDRELEEIRKKEKEESEKLKAAKQKNRELQLVLEDVKLRKLVDDLAEVSAGWDKYHADRKWGPEYRVQIEAIHVAMDETLERMAALEFGDHPDFRPEQITVVTTLRLGVTGEQLRRLENLRWNPKADVLDIRRQMIRKLTDIYNKKGLQGVIKDTRDGYTRYWRDVDLAVASNVDYAISYFRDGRVRGFARPEEELVFIPVMPGFYNERQGFREILGHEYGHIFQDLRLSPASVEVPLAMETAADFQLYQSRKRLEGNGLKEDGTWRDFLGRQGILDGWFFVPGSGYSCVDPVIYQHMTAYPLALVVQAAHGETPEQRLQELDFTFLQEALSAIRKRQCEFLETPPKTMMAQLAGKPRTRYGDAATDWLMLARTPKGSDMAMSVLFLMQRHGLVDPAYQNVLYGVTTQICSVKDDSRDRWGYNCEYVEAPDPARGPNPKP
ncbi:MAG: hypothetical protein M3O22_00440 [Pseudomonadota bacterium]|nr:hypothetical protein [Pseudomonadota bacterium]